MEFPAGAAIQDVVKPVPEPTTSASSHPEWSPPPPRPGRAAATGCPPCAIICGTQDIHRTLEQKLTAFLGTEDTILFPSCMDANAGVFEAILGAEDIIISDRLVHASVVDGMRLCKGRARASAHADMEHLEQSLEHADKRVKM